MVKVLGLGDNVCDVYLHTGTMYPGGQALNFAVYASQLGAQADFLGVFGQDGVASHIQAVLDEKWVGRTHCRSYPGENGFARVTLVEGDRVFQGSNRGGVLQEHPIALEEADVPYLSTFDLIHTTNNGFIDGLLPQLHALPSLVSYDFSFRWNEEDRVDRVCPYIDFAFLSCSDLDDEQTQNLCRHLHEKGCGVVTATRGSKGATVFDGVRFYQQLPHLVEPVDTMGAGDSFATAMLVSILQALEKEGREAWNQADFRSGILPQALDKAASFSSQTCLVHGAFGCGVPVPEELRPRMYEGDLMKLDRNRIALGSYHYFRYPLDYFLDTAVELGLSAVELWAAAPQLCLELISDRELRAIRAQLQQRGLRVCCVTPEQCTYPVNLAAEEESLRRYSIQTFRRAIQTAALLDSPLVLVTAGCGYFNRPLEEAWERSADSLNQLAQYAQAHGVRLALETLTPLSSNILNTPEQQRAMLSRLPAGSALPMLDVGQMVYMDQDLSRYLAHGSALGHVHLHDSHPNIHMALGDGDLPIGDYIAQLEGAGYTGMYAFECNDPAYRQDPRAADRQNIAWLEKQGIL